MDKDDKDNYAGFDSDNMPDSIPSDTEADEPHHQKRNLKKQMTKMSKGKPRGTSQEQAATRQSEQAHAALRAKVARQFGKKLLSGLGNI